MRGLSCGFPMFRAPRIERAPDQRAPFVLLIVDGVPGAWSEAEREALAAKLFDCLGIRFEIRVD